ncbi:MAG: YlbF family regulator [Spirochaetota bacterium]
MPGTTEQERVTLDTTMLEAADRFARALYDCDESRDYRKAVERVETDPEFSRLRRELGETAGAYNAAHANGTLSHEMVARMQQLQQLVQFHDVNREYKDAESLLKERFAACNELISEEIGFDFARIAAPHSGGCGTC